MKPIPSSIYDIPLTTLDGAGRTMADYRGRTLLIVNVASRCGFTPQYAGLEDLYRKFADRDFAVLGFPCDQFGHEEPGTDAEIQRFCADEYAVTFPLFTKTDVNGPNTHPLFKLLKQARPGLLGTGAIKWNFTKFLVSPSGEVLERFGPAATPHAIERVLREWMACFTD